MCVLRSSVMSDFCSPWTAAGQTPLYMEFSRDVPYVSCMYLSVVGQPTSVGVLIDKAGHWHGCHEVLPHAVDASQPIGGEGLQHS